MSDYEKYFTLVERAKKRVFYDKLYSDNLKIRKEYSYIETPRATWVNGVETYPVCPFCGKSVGEVNKEFRSGDFCDYICLEAWFIKYHWEEIEKKLLLLLNENLNGAGI